jgi:hypothetical protein
LHFCEILWHIGIDLWKILIRCLKLVYFILRIDWFHNSKLWIDWFKVWCWLLHIRVVFLAALYFVNDKGRDGFSKILLGNLIVPIIIKIILDHNWWLLLVITWQVEWIINDHGSFLHFWRSNRFWSFNYWLSNYIYFKTVIIIHIQYVIVNFQHKTWLHFLL